MPTIGTPLDFRLGFGRAPTFDNSTKVAQIDIDAADIGRNRGIDVGVTGDVKMVLLQLMDEMRHWMKAREEPAWVDKLREQESKTEAAQEADLNSNQVPIHPLRLCKEVRDFVTGDTIIVGTGAQRGKSRLTAWNAPSQLP